MIGSDRISLSLIEVVAWDILILFGPLFWLLVEESGPCKESDLTVQVNEVKFWQVGRGSGSRFQSSLWILGIASSVVTPLLFSKSVRFILNAVWWICSGLSSSVFEPNRTATENVYTLLQPPRSAGRAGSPGEGADGKINDRQGKNTLVLSPPPVPGIPHPGVGGSKHPFYSPREVHSARATTSVHLLKVCLRSDLCFRLLLLCFDRSPKWMLCLNSRERRTSTGWTTNRGQQRCCRWTRSG